MKKLTIFLLNLLVLLLPAAFGQKPVIELTFSAEYYDQYVPIDSIYIENLTQGGDTTLIFPDTVIVLDYETGLISNPDFSSGEFCLLQNIPNPFSGETTITLLIPGRDWVNLSVCNILGEKVASFGKLLDAGKHTFVFYPGKEKYYFLSASYKGETKAIKMISFGSHAGKAVSLHYRRIGELNGGLKSSGAISDLGFSLGDTLRFIGYANTSDMINGSDVIENAPVSSQNFVFKIFEGIPCPGTPMATYEGQSYITVQISAQCWIKENLNVGTMINGSQNQTNNSIMEKYCYDNSISNCAIYGGLYQWDEMMQYSIAQGTQGICPENWHLPSEAEWCTLTLFIDPTVDCNAEGLSGTDAGTKMKSTTGWNSGGSGTNVSGFNALPGGFFINSGVGGYFEGIAASGKFLTSSEYTIGGGKLIRGLYNYSAGIDRMAVNNLDGLSVRCVKNEGSATIPTVTTAAISGITQTTATGGGEVTDDGGAEVQIRGVCWSTSQNPTFADNHTIDGAGIGSFVSELNGLASNTPYFVRAYAINSAGYAYGNEVTFTTLSSGFNCGDVVNYEGQNYNTILIGTQCWFKENLNIGTMINVSQNQTNNGIIEKYCYDNSSSNCATRGGLYQWNEMMQYTTTQGAQGICPENWHLPTDAEWIILTDYVSSQPENLCNGNTNYIAKSLAATTNWSTSSSICAIGNNLSANNATGFTALPGGLRWPDGLFSGLNSDGNWWSSTQHPDPDYAFKRWLFYQQPTVNGAGSQKIYGFSVRCIRNN